MPWVFEDIVDLWIVRNIIPGDDHVNLGISGASASPIDISVRTDCHVAPVRSRMTQGARVEGLISHHGPLRLTS